MKAQISLEFITFVGILLFITALASFIAFNNISDMYQNSIDRDARSVAKLVATEINIATEAGTGYSHKFSLPHLLYGEKNYSLNTTNQDLYIFWPSKSYFLPILAYNVTGQPQHGLNTIKNINGAIIFE
ncbi:MAG: hypothetical protein NT120_03950 [Candidatus Aenigmarchaeota archaeon]|nr:hypothetical protein [Candidatus Aenigmarchaeota archaeon]